MVDLTAVLAQEFEKNDTPFDRDKILKILDANDGARIRTWLNICSRCGLCAESCFVYLANDRDPRLSPAYKFQHTLGAMYRRKGRITQDFLKKCYEISWLQCTMCKRCSIFCPFGIDIATMIAISRSICHSQGFKPGSLSEFSENCRKSGNHMAIPEEELIDTCDWMEEETEDAYRGVKIPVDQAKVKYMYTINPREPVYYPQDISNAAVIFAAARESWTIPSFGWDCTNLPMFCGDRALAGQQVRNVYEKALELGAEKILITECGHAYRSLAFEGPYLAGYKNGRPPCMNICGTAASKLIPQKKSRCRSPTRTRAMCPETAASGKRPARSFPISRKISGTCHRTATTITAAAGAAELCPWALLTNRSAWPRDG